MTPASTDDCILPAFRARVRADALADEIKALKRQAYLARIVGQDDATDDQRRAASLVRAELYDEMAVAVQALSPWSE